MVNRREFARMLMSAGLCAALPSFAEPPARKLRVAVSSETIPGTNLNDARAAYRVWGEQIAKSFQMGGTEMFPDVFVSSERMIQMIREASIDCFVITAIEYATVLDALDPEWLLVEDYCADGLEYVIVVHESSPYKKLEDLRGLPLSLYRHRDTVLLPPWLNVALASAGMPPTEKFFSNQIVRDSPSQVLLPVFFKSSPAAALTGRAFKVATELNPQMSRSIRVLATSPKVIPEVFCFRRGCRGEDKQQLKQAVVKLQTVPAGQQVLRLYQSSGMVERTGASMTPTLNLLRQYERLRGRSRS